jgi:hypothetical protein
VTPIAAAEIQRINDDESVRWIVSFLSADKRKTYCFYEAPDAEPIRRPAKRAKVPADVITPIGGEIGPRRVRLTLPDPVDTADRMARFRRLSPTDGKSVESAAHASALVLLPTRSLCAFRS